MTDEFTESQKQKVFVEIATALTQRKGRSAQEALKLISGAIKGQDLTEAQNRFLAQQISVTLFGGATPTASEAASNLVN